MLSWFTHFVCLPGKPCTPPLSNKLLLMLQNPVLLCLPLFFFKLIATLFIYLFLAVLGLRFLWGLSLVAASGGHSSSWCGGHSSSRCVGLSLTQPLPLRGTVSRRAGSAVVAHGPSCSAACGIFPRPGLEPVSPALAGRFSTIVPPGKPTLSSSWCVPWLPQN